MWVGQMCQPRQEPFFGLGGVSPRTASPPMIKQHLHVLGEDEDHAELQQGKIGGVYEQFQIALSRILHLVAVQPKQETNKFWSYTCLDFVKLL